MKQFSTKTVEVEAYQSIEAGPEQIERLAELGVLTPDQLEAGRKTGRLVVKVPKSSIDDGAAQIDRLAAWLDQNGLNSTARLFIGSNRPLNFFASQFLLFIQPFSTIAFGTKDKTGSYSKLLARRSNLDCLLSRLEEMEQSHRPEAGKKSRTRKGEIQ